MLQKNASKKRFKNYFRNDLSKFLYCSVVVDLQIRTEIE
jgi:hypothetical protein